jgi:hypothetical protein
LYSRNVSPAQPFGPHRSAWPGKTGSFGKPIVSVCDYEKKLFGAIIRCALRKRAGAFCSFLPSPIKRHPRRGLYKERILKSFRFFYRSHYLLLVTTSNYAEKPLFLHQGDLFA